MSNQPDSQLPPAEEFEPVRLRARRDGWTAERQRAFIDALRASRCVLAACRSVGMSSESAYKLARRPGAQSFRRAWDEALAGPKPLRPPEPASKKRQASADGTVPAAPVQAPRRLPAYSLGAFRRAALIRSRRAAPPSPSSTSGPDR